MILFLFLYVSNNYGPIITMYLVPFYTGSQPSLAHTRLLSISGLLITSWPMEVPSLIILNKVNKSSI